MIVGDDHEHVSVEEVVVLNKDHERMVRGYARTLMRDTVPQFVRQFYRAANGHGVIDLRVSQLRSDFDNSQPAAHARDSFLEGIRGL